MKPHDQPQRLEHLCRNKALRCRQAVEAQQVPVPPTGRWLLSCCDDQGPVIGLICLLPVQPAVTLGLGMTKVTWFLFTSTTFAV